MTGLVIEDAACGRARIVPLTVDQYHRMIAAGILAEGEPIELLDGVLVVKDRGAREDPRVTISPPHGRSIVRLTDLVARVRDEGHMHLRVQLPITVPPDQEPEPDGSIVRGTADDYAERHPGPEEVCVAIEVSDSSLRRDRTTKLRIYARARIPQYVIVNIPDDVVEVYEQPARARYKAVRTIERGSRVSLRLAEGTYFDVDAAELLP